MTLRGKKRLLILFSLAQVALVALTIRWGMTPPATEDSPQISRTTNTLQNTLQPEIAANVAPAAKQFESLWNRPLRRPLYDPPPPPPKKIVKKPPPPIRAKLLATMIEPGKSMAMLQLGGRDVVFLKVGDPLGTANPNAKIAEIRDGKIVILQGEHKTQLTVPGSGGN